MKIDVIRTLNELSWNEDYDLEFKSAKGGLPKSLWETYSAMSNTQGGLIMLGVEDDGVVSGVSDLCKIKRDFWNTINNRGKVSANLLSDQDVREFTYNDKSIFVIKVPKATRSQIPVFIGQNPFSGSYRRNYDGDYHCTRQEINRMFADASQDSADCTILDKYGLDDIDLSSLHQYRQRFMSHKPTHPWLSEDDKGLLIKLGGWRKNRASGQEGLTVAGLLMFGKDDSIREGLPSYSVDYREKCSDDPEVRWTDRLTIDGTWHPNLFQFYLRAMQRLFSDLKLPFALSEDLHRKGESPVHEAIREALINALVHADYFGQGGIVIQKHADCFGFSNPGSLLVSLDQMFKGNVSECRNKILQTMFMMIGGAEKAGSGVDRIRRGWASQHWRLPLIRLQMQPDRVDWSLPMTSLMPEKSLVRLRDMLGQTVFSELSRDEVLALVTADVEEYVTNERMCQLTDSHSSELTMVLQNLVSRGWLMQENRGRWSKYRLGEHSLHSKGHSLHSKGHSLHSKGHSLHSEGHSLHSAKMDEVFARLQVIANSVSDKKRVLPEEMEKVILLLCKGKYLSRKQLSLLLNRNSEGLRARFLVGMVKHGVLALKYPDKPNRVDQAYITTEQGEREL